MTTSDNQTLDDTATPQQAIELELLPCGFLAKGRKDIMEQGKMDQLEYNVTHLQHIFWSTVMEPRRRKKFEIQHGKGNQAKSENDKRLGD